MAQFSAGFTNQSIIIRNTLVVEGKLLIFNCSSRLLCLFTIICNIKRAAMTCNFKQHYSLIRISLMKMFDIKNSGERKHLESLLDLAIRSLLWRPFKIKTSLKL